MVTMTTQYIGRTHYNGHPDSIGHMTYNQLYKLYYIAKAAIQITGIVQTRRVTMTLLIAMAITDTQTILASMATITIQAKSVTAFTQTISAIQDTFTTPTILAPQDKLATQVMSPT